VIRWALLKTLSVAATLAILYFISTYVGPRLQEYVLNVVVLCGIYVILAVSLNLINGITGQFSIGHAGFFAVGAYVGSAWSVIWLPRIIDLPFLKLGTFVGDATNLVIAIILGSLAAGVAGFIVGLPSLRLRGDYLAIVTLGFGEVIRVLLLNTEAVGGARGMSGIPALVGSFHMELFWILLLIVMVIAVSRNLMRSVRGLTFLAVREDEIAADAMGVNTTKVKVTAFVIGSMFAGAAGVLYAHFFTGISPDAFDMNTSIIITTMVVLGGTGSVSGSLIAAVLLTALPEFLRFMKDYRMVIFSTTLIVMMLTRPQGIFGHKEIGLPRFLRRRKPVEQGGAA
jgi:branched-chain amino acid transport system permease protein